jgi:hypothetical protein
LEGPIVICPFFGRDDGLTLAYNASVSDRRWCAVHDIKTIAAKWYVGELSGEDMPSIACEALEQGHDGVNLRYLAGLSSPTRRDIQKIVDSALKELGVQAPITRHDAALWLASHFADDIVAGRIEPYAGASRIWLFYACDAPELEHWSRLVTDFEVATESGKTEKARSQIVQEAKALSSAVK